MANTSNFFGKCCVALAAFFFGPTAALAQDTFLTLKSAISGAEITMTKAEFMALDQMTLNTSNEFVDEVTAFDGPLARDVVALLGGVPGDTVELTAINDYSIEVPVSDFFDYDVIFAHTVGGVQLSPRDKGPIWVVYPMSDFPELAAANFNARLIWQLVKVEIK